MIRKIISLITLVSFISLFFYSCQNEIITGVSEESPNLWNNPEVANIRLESPGKIHNGILQRFHQKHSLFSKEKMEPEDFIALVVESTNSAFEENNIPVNINSTDVHIVLGMLLKYKEEGVYNFFSDTHDLPVDLFKYLEREYGASSNILDKYLNALSKIRNYEKSPLMKEPIIQSPVGIIMEGFQDNQYCADIFNSSYKFWNSMLLSEYHNEKLSWKDYQDIIDKFAFEPDLVVTIIMIYLPSGPVIDVVVSIIASVVFTCGTNCDWSNYGHHTR